jgi:ABC-2 type transport system permease protein
VTSRYLVLEARRAYRNRRFLFFTLVMPLGLFLIYVQLYGDSGELNGTSATDYLMVSMACFGALSAAMSTGTRIAIERQAGWNRQLRLTPLRPVGYLLAKGTVAMLVALPAIALVYAAGAAVTDGAVSVTTWAVSAFTVWLAVVPFAVLGLLIGYVASPDSSQAIFSAVFMTMSLLGGIFIPVEVMPDTLADIAKVMPSYWLGVLGRSPFGTASVEWEAVPILLAWTVVLGVLVMRRYRTDTARA